MTAWHGDTEWRDNTAWHKDSVVVTQRSTVTQHDGDTAQHSGAFGCCLAEVVEFHLLEKKLITPCPCQDFGFYYNAADTQ